VNALPDSRASVVVSLAAMEGLRRSEILGLQLDDIDVGNRLLHVVSAKTGGEVDVLPLTDVTAKWVAVYVAEERGRAAGPLIRSRTHGGGLSGTHLGAEVRRWFGDAGLKEQPFDGRSLHALRHVFAEALLVSSKDPSLVQAGLRHRSLQSTWTYLRNKKSTEDLRPHMGHGLPPAA
jgi:integrase